MKAVAEAILRVQPKPDPLPVRPESLWVQHAPWILACLVVGGCGLALESATWGAVAAGAGIMAIAAAAVQARVRWSCFAVHHAAGVLVLGIWHGAEAAGSFANAAGIAVIGVLCARAATLEIRDAVAPLAGRLPWRFHETYKRSAIRFGVVAIVAAIALAVLGTSAPVRIVGVALLPLALRTYNGTMLSSRAMRRMWIFSTIAHVTLLLALVPHYGPVAAAWVMVFIETILFIGSALVLARRTGVTPLPTMKVAGLVAAGVVMLAATIPGSSEWPFFISIFVGVGAGAILFPKS